MSSKSSHLVAMLMIGSTFVLGGCGVGTEDEAGGEEAASLATTQQEISSGWTSYTSEEYAPISCDGGSLISAFQCSGSDCDNIRAYCQPAGGVRGSSYWTPYFSEEGTNYRYCDYGYWITGLACSGSYCDNISLQCSYMSNFGRKNCYWTGWMSEENGGYLGFGSGYYAVGVQCNGDHCDNKRYYVCQP
ncbi:hypothetical protein JQX13_46325 [Archangium violaceum]|uniref:hypothetical protein n=1 Tax=Archangium violaceum TaxID=83451 RepID=UPI00193BABC1|nr:hypothetical protein [Archangium violaceum]QRK07367.1 hypothetical protein JQX13_46325 [Archangium violaceum]